MWYLFDVLVSIVFIFNLCGIFFDCYWVIMDLIKYVFRMMVCRMWLFIVLVWLFFVGILFFVIVWWKVVIFDIFLVENECIFIFDSVYLIILFLVFFYCLFIIMMFVYWRIYMVVIV